MLSLLFLLPAALATTLTATSPLASNSVIEYSGSCTSSGTVGIQISFMGNMVHFDQLTGSPNFASSSSTTPYTAAVDGDYTISASCAGESAESATVCVGSSCPTEEEASGGSPGTSEASESGDPLVVVGSDDSNADVPKTSTNTPSKKASTTSIPASTPSTTSQQDTEEGSSGLILTLILIALLAAGGFFLWKKYKKPQGYSPTPQTQ